MKCGSRGLREPPDLDQSKAKPCKADGNTILLLNFNETDGAVSVMDSVRVRLEIPVW